MKRTQLIFIIAMLGMLAGVAITIYDVFLGPGRMDLAGKSFAEIVESGLIIPLLVVPGVLILSLGAFLPFVRLIFPPEIKNGVVASAKIQQVWDTGVTLNKNPQIGFLLEVQPAQGSPFTVKTNHIVSRLNLSVAQPGGLVEVIYDPQKPERIQITKFSGQAQSTGDSAARLEELNRLRDKGLITEDEYRQKRQEILKAL